MDFLQNIKNLINKALERLELPFMFIFIIGIFLKVFSSLPVDFLITFILSILANLYVLSAYIISKTAQTNKIENTFNFVSSFFFAIGCIGIMFKLNNWPGAQNMLNICFVYILMIPVKFILVKKGIIQFNKKLLIRMIFFGTIGISLMAIPQKTLLKYHIVNKGK